MQPRRHHKLASLREICGKPQFNHGGGLHTKIRSIHGSTAGRVLSKERRVQPHVSGRGRIPGFGAAEQRTEEWTMQRSHLAEEHCIRRIGWQMIRPGEEQMLHLLRQGLTFGGLRSGLPFG